jgi:bifunctional UDP-N-acetylglucosamine pyrophosphorylase/glucosamine-1-phosphate N-acetyltransferase
VLILYGDVPLLTTALLRRLVDACHASTAGLSFVTTFPKNPKGYGRVLREGGKVVRVVEEKDATPAQREIGEINAGIYVARSEFLFPALAALKPSNAQQEYYLTDIVEQAVSLGQVETVVADFEETAGVNDLAELSERAQILRARINTAHMKNGVSLLHPETTFIDEGVQVGSNTVIGPMVSISSGSVVGDNVRIGQGCVLVKSLVADGTEVKPYSVFEEAVVGPRCTIGPFSRLRPGTDLAEGVHLGNFVETKKARIGKGSKANHLAYLGDAEIGSGVNVGAGTITCNYDGVNKHVTVMEDGVFIGSDSQLVAPVTVGKGAYVGAGSTITKNVPPGSLAFSRAPQVVKEGWAQRKKKASGKS